MVLPVVVLFLQKCTNDVVIKDEGCGTKTTMRLALGNLVIHWAHPNTREYLVIPKVTYNLIRYCKTTLE